MQKCDLIIHKHLQICVCSVLITFVRFFTTDHPSNKADIEFIKQLQKDEGSVEDGMANKDVHIFCTQEISLKLRMVSISSLILPTTFPIQRSAD